MAQALSPWRVLRPIFLAGAATVAWLTISTSPAMADTSPESGSLLAGATSSVSSLAAPLSASLTATVEPIQTAVSTETLPSDSSGGLVQSMAGSVAGTADQLVAAVPVVNSVIPADTVSAVAVPVAAVADETATGLVEALVPELTGALPVLEPVLPPAADLVSPLLQAPLTDLPLTGDVSGQQELDAGTADSPIPVPAATGQPATAAGSAAKASPPLQGFAGSSYAVTWPAGPSVTPGSAKPGGPSSPPAPAPAGPVSGAGSGASPSGPLGAAACLDDFGLGLPLRESFPFDSAPAHAPSPVSFDPGSSPD